MGWARSLQLKSVVALEGRTAMPTFALESIADLPLLDGLDRAVGREQLTTAEVVAHIAEVDRREAYRIRGYDSMHEYVVAWCHLSDDGAYRRIQAARAAREWPCLFDELAQGRLNLSAVCLLAPHLTQENHRELVRAARHQSNAQIKQWLAGRLWTAPSTPGPSPARRQLSIALPRAPRPGIRNAGPPVPALPATVPPEPAVAVAHPGPTEFEMRFTIGLEVHARFRYAQALLSHAIPSGDVAAIFHRAIEAVITECEKRKFAATGRPPTETADPARKEHTGRHVPAAVRREVWARDEGRCTQVSASGQRCGAHRFLEFDHVTPIARGGASTVANLRLRCRAHNQAEATRVLGARFMNEKRRKAAIARSIGRALPAWSPAFPDRGGP
jgi:5-methylcytosine-specific restriction endonuclease McrA